MPTIVPIAGSSSISGAGYDPETQTLAIVFKGGRQYTFDNVPPEVYQELMAADSPGAYYHQNIKGTYG